MGGDGEWVFYAPVSSTGVGAWTATTTYPTSIWEQSCAVYSATIYCVGGMTEPGDYSEATFYAPITSTGVGAWSSTTSYPASEIYYESCVAYSGYLYCVGGNQGSGPVNAVYYSQIFSSSQTSTTTFTQTITSTVTTTSISTSNSVSTSTAISTQTSTTTVTSTQLVPTTTKVTCSPKSVAEGSPTKCTATVKSADNSQLPGIVQFSSSGSGTFGTVSCKEISTGTKCTVTYTPSATGKQVITGTYPGDEYHAPSSETFALKVT